MRQPKLDILDGGKGNIPPPPEDGDPGAGGDEVEGEVVWRKELLQTGKGSVKLTFGNALHTLRHHPALRGRLGYNTRRLQPVWLKAPPWGDRPGPLTDADAGELALFLQGDMRVGYALSTCTDALLTECHQRPVDRVLEYLESLSWDHVPRLDSWLVRYLGVEQGGYATAVGRAWCISAVARALCPGCKADSMLVLEGPQGVGKSSALRILAGEELFAELAIDVGDKDSWLAIHGPWIVEWSELAGFSRREAEAIKSFLSRQVDRMRPPYGRVTSDFPRDVIFTGSTNESTYLGDPTGGRRYWPIRVGRVDLKGLEVVRDQIWAEAVTAYHNGEPWWLKESGEQAACVEQDHRLEVDPWEDLVAEILDRTGYVTRTSVRAVDIVGEIGVSSGSITAAHSRRVGKILDRLGWTRGQKQIGEKGRSTRVFFRPGGQMEVL